MKNTFLKIHSLTISIFFISLLSGYIKYTLIAFLIVLFHEMGHCFIIKLLGYKIKNITIYPFGGNTKIDKTINDHIYKDILIAFGGIFFQLIIFILCLFNIITDDFVYKANLSIMLFNLLPIIPLDGSKILMELLYWLFSVKKVLNIYPVISIINIIILVIINYIYNLDNFLIVLLFVYKSIEMLKNKNIYFHKFLLEKVLYDLTYKNIDYNKNINDYKKDTKYYYYQNNKIIDEKEYLQKYYY